MTPACPVAPGWRAWPPWLLTSPGKHGAGNPFRAIEGAHENLRRNPSDGAEPRGSCAPSAARLAGRAHADELLVQEKRVAIHHGQRVHEDGRDSQPAQRLEQFREPV